jgi:glucose/arabinose dehydrogenase
MKIQVAIATLPIALLSCSSTCAGETAFRPARRDATPQRIAGLRVPDGFTISVFAREVRDARMMALAPDGAVLVTQPEDDQVLLLRDRDGDGDADERRVLVDDLDQVHGITVRGDTVYLAPPTRVLAAELEDDRLGRLRTVLDSLPSGGRHPNRTLHFSPDGALFVSVGSSCNACKEKDPEHATLLVATGGGTRRIFARGLRNTIGFAWHPRTGQLWGMDHGSDGLGDDRPPEELNRLIDGGDYGWPAEQPGPDTVKPVLGYQAHAAPIDMVFWRGDALVAMHGSWNRSRAVGYEVVRIRFRDGKPQEFEPFLTGFLIEGGKAQFGRPAGLLVLSDRALLVSDDENGVIYRIGYKIAR